jgi:uncharacterized membrane protein
VNKSLKQIVRASLIASAYIVLVGVVPFISFGPIQVRFAEALTILPFFWIEAIPGLAIGCLVSNLLWSPFGAVDWVFGTLATLLAAIFTWILRKTGKIWIGSIPPVFFNTLIVSFYVSALLGFLDVGILSGASFSMSINNFSWIGYLNVAWTLALGEMISVGAIGVPLAYFLNKMRLLDEKV